MTTLVNDIIEVSMNIRLDIPEEDSDKTEIYAHDYKQNYEITYHNLREDSFGEVDFPVEAGFSPSFSDIESYLKEELHNDYEEIIDYELLESDMSDAEYQTAKIKVKAIK